MDWYEKRQSPRISAQQRKILSVIGIAVLFVSGNLLFGLKDQVCPYDLDWKCGSYVLGNIGIWIVRISLSALCFAIVVLLGIHKMKNIPLIVAGIINLLLLSYFYNNSIDHGHYGVVFGYYLRAFFLLEVLIYYMCCGIKYLYKKYTLWFIWTCPIIVFGIFYYTWKYSIVGSCDNWLKGLGGEMADFRQPYCKLHTPEYCFYDMLDGIFDYSNILKLDCSQMPIHKGIMDQIYDSRYPIIGYPRIEYFPKELRTTYTTQNTYLSNLVGLHKFEDPKAKDLEIFLDRRSEKLELSIKVKRNETLVNLRKAIKHKSLVNNFLIIYIDTLSRARSFKVIPKTLAWLEKFMNKKDPKRETIQFFKYHSITPYTQVNLNAALHGVPFPTPEGIKEPVSPPRYHMVKEFREKGFITGHALDFCPMYFETLNPQNLMWVEPYPFDHEGNAFACDPQYTDFTDADSRFQGPYSEFKRCLYGKQVHQYTIEYSDQFWRTYKNEKKMLYMDFIINHESTANVGKLLDKDLSEYLNKLEQDGLLDDTIIMLYADHGLHMPLDILKDTEVFPIERVLPALYMVLPSSLGEIRDIAKENQQKLVSAIQVHETFLAIAQGKDSPHLEKSLLGRLPDRMTCEDIHILETPCQCTYE